MSQNLDLGPGFYFMSKNGKIFTIFYLNFLDFIKLKPWPKTTCVQNFVNFGP